MYELKQLKNGVRLLLVPHLGVESLAVDAFIACGGRYEPSGISGVSHFLEHMVFKGTRNFPTFDDVHTVEKMGGVQNAYTDVDVTKIYCKVLAQDWEKAVSVVCDLVVNPLLPEKEFDPERKVIIEEMQARDDNLPLRAAEIYHKLTYGANSLGERLIGTRESLARIGREQMLRYHEEKYRADNIVVVLAGKLPPYGRLAQRVEELTTQVGKGGNGGFEGLVWSQESPRVVVEKRKKAEQTNLSLGFRVCGRKSLDRYALQVANLILGSGFTSRLFREIREKQGLCYSIHSSVGFYDDAGDLTVEAATSHDQVEQAVERILAELRRLLEGSVTEAELESAKKRFSAGVAFACERPESMGEFFGRQEVFGQEVLSLDRYLERIMAVTSQDIDRVLAEYMVDTRTNLAVLTKQNGIDEERCLEILRV